MLGQKAIYYRISCLYDNSKALIDECSQPVKKTINEVEKIFLLWFVLILTVKMR